MWRRFSAVFHLVSFFVPEKAFYSTCVYKNRLVALSLHPDSDSADGFRTIWQIVRYFSPKGCKQKS